MKEVAVVAESIDAAIRLLEDGRAREALDLLSGRVGASTSAHETLDRLAEEHPDLAGVFVARGHMYLDRGQVNAALDEYAHASERDEEDVAALLGCATCQRRLGMHDAAADTFAELVELDPDNGALWVEYGDAALAAGDAVSAAAAYDEAIQAGYDGTAALVGRAQAAIALDMVGDGLDDLRAAVEQSNKSAELWELLGLALYDAGHDKEAVVAFEKALAIDAERASSHRGLGDARWIMEDRPGALVAYRRALEIDPDDSDTLLGLAELHLEMGAASEATAAAEKALGRLAPGFASSFAPPTQPTSDRWPEAAEAVTLLARARVVSGDLPGARTLLEQALEAAPDAWDLYAERAQVLLRQGLRHLALRDARWALEGDPALEEAEQLHDQLSSELGLVRRAPND